MKSVAVILCGFLLALAQLFAAPAVTCAAPVKARACCHCGGKMACCAASQNTNPLAAATTIRVAPTNEISLPPQIFLLPPLVSQPTAISAIAAIFQPATTPLYARDCARLI